MTDTADIHESPTLAWLSGRGVDCSGARVLFPYARQELLRRLGRRMGIDRADQLHMVIHRLAYSPQETFKVDFREQPLAASCGGLRELLNSQSRCLVAFNFQTDVVRMAAREVVRALCTKFDSPLDHEWGAYILAEDLARVWVIDWAPQITLTHLHPPPP